nr:hypothetical protein [Valsa mali var. pyri (nom. inval.)]
MYPPAGIPYRESLRGFPEGESGIKVTVKKIVKLIVEPEFQIGLNRKDEGLLKLIKASFECQEGLELPGGKVGRIQTDKNKSLYRVTSVSGLANIIAHFDKYPLLTKKRKDYFIWREVVLMMRPSEGRASNGRRDQEYS